MDTHCPHCSQPYIGHDDAACIWIQHERDVTGFRQFVIVWSVCLGIMASIAVGLWFVLRIAQ